MIKNLGKATNSLRVSHGKSYCLDVAVKLADMAATVTLVFGGSVATIKFFQDIFGKK